MGFFSRAAKTVFSLGRKSFGSGGPYSKVRPTKSLLDQKRRYTILGPDGTKKYAGKAVNVKRRVHQHKFDGKYDPSVDKVVAKYAKPGTSHTQVSKDETRYIKKHRPALNKRMGSPGRPPKDGE